MSASLGLFYDPSTRVEGYSTSNMKWPIVYLLNGTRFRRHHLRAGGRTRGNEDPKEMSPSSSKQAQGMLVDGAVSTGNVYLRRFHDERQLTIREGHDGGDGTGDLVRRTRHHREASNGAQTSGKESDVCRKPNMRQFGWPPKGTSA
jgi:hypothetical protein